MADGTKQKKPRTGTYYTHVALAYLGRDGIVAVERLHADEALSRDTVKQAIKHLAADGHDAAPLEKWYGETFGAGNRVLKVGETRAITVQQAKKGGPFLRLGVDKDRWPGGSVINVTRTEDGGYRLG